MDIKSNSEIHIIKNELQFLCNYQEIIKAYDNEMN